MLLKRILVVVLIIKGASLYAGVAKDSVGVEKKNGKTYIVHKIENKETLYALARKYGVSVDDIKSSNEGLKDLKAGEKILIPYKNGVTNSGKSHTVKSGETLYSIAKQYSVKVDELKKANPGVDDLKVGQTINIPGAGKIASEEEKPKQKKSDSKASTQIPETYTVQPKETLYSISKKFGLSVDEIKKLNPGITDLKAGQVIVLSSTSKRLDATNIETVQENQEETTTPVTEKPVRKPDNQEKRNYVAVKEPHIVTGPENNVPTFSNLKKDGYTKVNETGMAEVYQDNSGFHYALHKSAPVGTIIYIVNEENGQKVFVRVMGKLTDAPTGVILKLSPKAFEKIAGNSPKVKVNATYIP